MKQYLITAAATAIILSSCGSSTKDNNAKLNDQKTALEKLRNDKTKLDEQIKNAETELNKLDPANSTAQKPKLVSVQTLAPADFSHYIELQGRIESENISYVTPRGMGGVVKAIYVKQGDMVKKGRLLMKLDDVIARQSLAASKEGLESIKSQLAYAKNIYQRQKNLWDQNIGTEVQVITAKNSFVTKPIATAYGIEHLIGSDPEMVNGEYTGGVTGMPTYKEGKVIRINQWLAERGKRLEDFEVSYFYSDSHNDLPLMKLVTNPVAVDADDTLIAHAEKYGWPLISLR